MADEETHKMKRLGFARAFTEEMYRNGGGGNKKHFVMVALAVFVFAGVAVAVGALTSHKQGGVTVAADAGELRTASPLAASARAGAGPVGTPKRAASSAWLPGTSQVPVSPASGSQLWTPPGQMAPAPPAFQGPPADQPGPAPASSWPTSAAHKPTSAGPRPAAQGSQSAKAPPRSPGWPPSPSPPKWVVVTGQVNCTSGRQIVGFWIQTEDKEHYRGWANWMVVGGGSNADYWLAVPPDVRTSGYRMSVGCGGTPQSWAVPTYTPLVFGLHNSFHCDDQENTMNTRGFGSCVLRG